MAYRMWQVELDGADHRVELEHRVITMSGKRTIQVDGQVIERSSKFWDTGTEHRFKISGHPCILRIRNLFMGYEYELWVDGRLV